MSKFADKTGQTWTVEVTVGDLKPLREDYEIDLKDITEEEMKSILPWISKPEKLVELLWHFCQEEAAKRDVTPEQFGRLFNPKAVRESAVAVVGAVVDFSLGPKVAEEVMANLRAEMEGADERGVGRFIAAYARERSKNSAGNSGAPSALTPAPSA